MNGLWAGISGIIEKDEEPLSRAKIEIFEEAGITEDKITLIKTNEEMNRVFVANQTYNVEDRYSSTINNAKETNNSLIDEIVNEILDQLRIYYS